MCIMRVCVLAVAYDAAAVRPNIWRSFLMPEPCCLSRAALLKMSRTCPYSPCDVHDPDGVISAALAVACSCVELNKLREEQDGIQAESARLRVVNERLRQLLLAVLEVTN